MINRRQFVTNVAGLAIAGFTSKKANAAPARPNSPRGSLNGPLRRSVFLPLVGQTFTVTGRSQSPIAIDRKSTRLNSSHIQKSRMPSSA